MSEGQPSPLYLIRIGLVVLAIVCTAGLVLTEPAPRVAEALQLIACSAVSAVAGMSVPDRD